MKSNERLKVVAALLSPQGCSPCCQENVVKYPKRATSVENKDTEKRVASFKKCWQDGTQGSRYCMEKTKKVLHKSAEFYSQVRVCFQVSLAQDIYYWIIFTLCSTAN